MSSRCSGTIAERLRIVGLTILSACAATLTTTKYTHADTLYDQQNGLWASPNCETPQLYLYNQGDAYLFFWKSDVSWVANLSIPETSRTTPSHIIEVTKTGEGYLLSYAWFENDLLKMWSGQTEKSPPNIQTVLDLPTDNAQPQTYHRCEKLPPSLYAMHAEGLKTVQFIAAIEKNCSQESGNCVEYLFSFLDVSEDEKLSVAELSRAIRIATYASVAAAPDGVNDKTFAGTFLVSNLIGPVVAKSLIDGSDYNSDGQLSLDEIFYDRDIATVGASLGKVSLDALGTAVGPLLQGLLKLGKVF